MENAHRLLVQAVMSRRIVADQDMHSLYERLKDGFHRNELFRDLESFVAHINRHLEPFGFGIKSGRAENATGDVFWVFTNTHNDERAKLATSLSPVEVLFFKKIIEEILRSDEGSLSRMEAVKLRSHLDSQRTVTGGLERCEELCAKWIADGWLVQLDDSDELCVGVRTVLELSDLVRSTDGIDECALCHTLVVRAFRCPSPDCPARVHEHCGTRFFEKAHTCPTCSQPWQWAQSS